jgi:hypothetical protein
MSKEEPSKKRLIRHTKIKAGACPSGGCRLVIGSPLEHGPLADALNSLGRDPTRLPGR